MPRALEGVRVVAFGTNPAGALTGMLLADHGADITQIARPGVAPLFPAADAIWRRGQRRVFLDLATPPGFAAAAELVRTADVVIENGRPGGMARFNFDAATLIAANPSLIHCSLPGFSASDTGRSHLPGWEGLIQAAAAASHPWFEGATGVEAPVFNALPIASTFAAFHAVTAITAALVERAHSGVGQAIEVSLYGAMYTALGSLGMRIHSLHTAPNQVINFVPLVRQYECGDGRWLQIHAFTRRAVRQFAIVAGVESWIVEGVLRLGPVIADPAVRAELQSRLERLFLTRPAQEWEDQLSAAGVSAAVCRTTTEWLSHPHALDAGLVLDAPEGGNRAKQPGPIVELSGESPNLTNDAVLSAESRPNRIGSASSAAPLAGLRVIDLCIVLAGTTCGRTLAEYGADVIKIDDPNRDGGVIFHNDVNRGKRSILLDLKTDAGKDVFWRLLESADVVVENFRAGVVERLGIDYAAVRARHPRIVYVSLNTYGRRGSWSGRPGWEQLAEAASGMQTRYGGDGRPTLQPFAVLDFGAGLVAAFGAMLALRRRQRAGLGQHVTTSLIATAVTLQSSLMNVSEMDRAGGAGATGPSWRHRYYHARDGWLFLAAAASQVESLGHALGIPGLASADAGAAATMLENVVAGRDTETVLLSLASVGIPAMRARSINDVMRDPWATEHGLSLQREHGNLGLVDTIGPVPFLSRTPLLAGAPATFPGIDAPGILREAGFGPDAIATLVADRVVVLPHDSTGPG